MARASLLGYITHLIELNSAFDTQDSFALVNAVSLGRYRDEVEGVNGDVYGKFLQRGKPLIEPHREKGLLLKKIM